MKTQKKKVCVRDEKGSKRQQAAGQEKVPWANTRRPHNHQAKKKNEVSRLRDGKRLREGVLRAGRRLREGVLRQPARRREEEGGRRGVPERQRATSPGLSSSSGAGGRRGEGGKHGGRPHLTRSRKESTVFLLGGAAPGSPKPGVLRAAAPAPGRMMKPRATARPEASSVVPKK